MPMRPFGWAALRTRLPRPRLSWVCRLVRIAKSVLMRAGADGAVLCITAGDRRVATLTDCRQRLAPVRRADADAVRRHTGFAIGGVSPLGFAPAGGGLGAGRADGRKPVALRARLGRGGPPARGIPGHAGRDAAPDRCAALRVERRTPMSPAESPCINVCRIDARSGLCLGCARHAGRNRHLGRRQRAAKAGRAGSLARTPRSPGLAGARRCQHLRAGAEMKTIRFYCDPISPFAALAFWRLPEALAGRSYAVDYVPILFAAALKAHGHKGPAEIEPKRAWTYRHVAWLAREQGVPLRLPAAHPFNPLPLLRLAWACAPEGMTPSRRVVDRLMAHVWLADGAQADEPQRLADLQAELAPTLAPDSGDVKLRPAPSHRRRAGARRVRCAHLRAGGPPVLGPGQPAHAGRRAGWRPLV